MAIVSDRALADQVAQIRYTAVSQDRSDDCDVLFKVITIGDPGSGKSSLLKRLVEGKFIEGNVTVGVEFNSFLSQIEEKRVKL
jgi:GTPase SAR1 family protein